MRSFENYSCSSNFADAEWLFSELGRVVTENKTQFKDKTIVQKAVIAADLCLKARISREACREHVLSDRTQNRFVDIGALLKNLRSVAAFGSCRRMVY